MRLRLGRSPYRALEDKLGYAFRKHALLEAALTHRSYRFETPDVDKDNQRLEFLGDAVLGLIAATHIYGVYKDRDEGALTDLRSRVSSGKALAQIGKSIQLGEAVRLGKGEEQSGGRQRSTVVADALEAVIGAAYLDGGLKAAQRIFEKLFVPLLQADGHEAWMENPKGRLQELAQRRFGAEPAYRCVREEGPPHEKTFTVEVAVRGTPWGVGAGPNRRAAESAAAIQAVEALLKQGDIGSTQPS
jgi:ribonuclease III